MATAPIAERRRGLPGVAAIFRRLMPTSGALHEISAIDGLRALAILLVIWHHLYVFGALSGLDVGPAVPGYIAGLAFCGVFLFFIITGFLLFLPYARAIITHQPWPSARKFYLRRSLRILPGYYATLAILFFLEGGFFLLPGAAGSFYLGVLLLHDMRSDTFQVITNLNSPYWTLAVEWQFYLLLPWIALALAKLAGSRARRGFLLRLTMGLCALVVLGLSIRFVAASIHYGWGWEDPINKPGITGFASKLLYGIKGKYLEVFALGMALSVFYVIAVEQGALGRRWAAWLGSVATIAAVMGLIGCLFWAAAAHRIPASHDPRVSIFPPPDGESWSVLGEWVLGFCFALLVLGVLIGPPILRRFFSLAPLRFIGIISYSLYLWHYPILSLLIKTSPANGANRYLHFIISGLVLSLLVSTASYYLIERPFIRYRRAAHSPAERAPAPVVGAS